MVDQTHVPPMLSGPNVGDQSGGCEPSVIVAGAKSGKEASERVFTVDREFDGVRIKGIAMMPIMSRRRHPRVGDSVDGGEGGGGGVAGTGIGGVCVGGTLRL